MTNQAAQTMPELPDSQYRGGNDVFGKEFPLYTADQMHQYARDYAAMLAAAPAASGGEDGLVAGIMAHFCNAIDNLNDMPVSDEWAKKWTAKAEFLIGMGPDPGNQSLSDTPSQAPDASVSERAREFPISWSDYWGRRGDWARSHDYAAFEAAYEWACANLDAIEQTLNQQRRECEAVADGEVLVVVTGMTGTGKSAVAGEIEILCRALGLEVEHDNAQERGMTHGDWTSALELYKPRVRIFEKNIPRKS